MVSNSTAGIKGMTRKECKAGGSVQSSWWTAVTFSFNFTKIEYFK
jgi:hypothetical protein